MAHRVTHPSLSRFLAISFVLILHQDTGQGVTLTSCGFESDVCGYAQRHDGYDQFDWTRGSGATPTANTGPPNASEGSYYLYIDTNSSNEGDKATLQTPGLSWTGTVCVSMSYHMYGEDIGTLILWRYGPRLDLLEKTGNQGNKWIQYQERINCLVFLTFVIEGFKGTGNKGDIAIDDFSVATGTCKTTVPLPYSCSFENDLCDMWQTGSDDLDWFRTHKSNPTPETGFPGDSSGEWVISLASDGKGNPEVASIETPEFDFAGDLCVRFKYYLSSNVSALRVYQDANSTSLAYFDSTATGAIWRSVSLIVRNFVRNHWITFRGRVGGGQAAAMALDDISISTQICDDCADNNGGCNQTCSITETGRMCTCRSGYLQFGETGCQDINECATLNAGCQQRCDNSAGSYSCSCYSGYTLSSDGHNCHDIDECSAGTDACSHECQNEAGRYTCHCPGGWSLTGDGYTCQDVDECATDTDNECDHVCTNVEGNYSCSCRAFYIRATDGRHCIECESAYEKRVAASELLTSECPATSSHTKITLDDCLLEACSTQTGVVAHLNMVCDLKRCDESNLRLKNVSGSSGWDIYVLNTTWSRFIMGGDPDAPRGEDAFPLVAVVAGVVVPVILLVVIVIVIVFMMRRRGSSRAGDQSVKYVNDAGQPGSVGEVRTPPINENQIEVGIYDEVTETPERQASVTDTEATYKNAAFHGEGHYQDLGPGESEGPKHYDVIQ